MPPSPWLLASRRLLLLLGRGGVACKLFASQPPSALCTNLPPCPRTAHVCRRATQPPPRASCRPLVVLSINISYPSSSGPVCALEVVTGRLVEEAAASICTTPPSWLLPTMI
mmetsp:Transcript_6060/g.17694  ORF Transcript_6060/g.17694 Transcript_6060/m.17694 type:complete len:112 (+) Transcript_6060:69-404(+)